MNRHVLQPTLGGGGGALVEAGDEVAQLLAEARPDGAAGAAVGLLVRQVLRQLLHQGAPAALQQDHQICARQRPQLGPHSIPHYECNGEHEGRALSSSNKKCLRTQKGAGCTAHTGTHAVHHTLHLCLVEVMATVCGWASLCSHILSMC